MSKVIQRDNFTIKKLKIMRQRKQKRMKFGILVPSIPEEAKLLDSANRNFLWQDAINFEMKNSKAIFELKESGSIPPIGYTKISCHLIFNIKLSLTCKVRYVTSGHITDVSMYMSYSSVVSRDAVFIGFLVSGLKGLDVMARDVPNESLQAKTSEMIFFYAGS